jgi:hypothetical protein
METSMKKTIAIVSFRATEEDVATLDMIRERMRASGSKKFATRADCLRIALAQAIVGSVNSHTPPGGGGASKTEHQPHALEHAQGEALPSPIEAQREAVPVASG